MKKILALLFAVILTVSVFTITSFAANRTETVPKVVTAPVKDGVKDKIYESGLIIDICNLNPAWTGTVQDGFSVAAYLVHDGTNLYIYAEAVGDATEAVGNETVYANDAFSPYFYNYAGILQTSMWYYNRDAGEDLFVDKLLNGNHTPLAIKSKNGSSDNAWGVEMVVAIEEIMQDLQDTALFDICYLDLNEDYTRNITVGAGNLGWTTTPENAIKLKFGSNIVVVPGTETKAPETQSPETKAPETQAPETKAPETKAPETAAPETKAPETKAPETKAPDTKAADTKAPETNAPDTKADGTNAPETKAPEKKKGCGSIVASLAIVPMLLAAAYVSKKH